jgi:hypothetical protein
MITTRIHQSPTISVLKVNIELHESLNNLMISKRNMIENILNILFLRQKNPLVVDENSILRKYLKGPTSNIIN